MIVDYKKFELRGKTVFEKAVIKPPFSKPNIMQDEACFFTCTERHWDTGFGENEEKVFARESILMKCGNYVSKMRSGKENGIYSAFAVHFYPDILKQIYQGDMPKFLSNIISNTVEIETTKVTSHLLISKYIQEFFIYFENPNLVTSDLLDDMFIFLTCSARNYL